MDSYIGLVGGVLGYVEDNIGEPLSAGELAAMAGLSPFHFTRMFTAVTGMSPRRYVVGRKLAHALDMLADPAVTVTDVALDLGFGCPESFSRAFRRQYGVTPTCYRESKPRVQVVEKVEPIDREMVDHGGIMAVRSSIVHRPPTVLRGETLTVNTEDADFTDAITHAAERLVADAGTAAGLDLDPGSLYCMVKCQGRDDGWYDVTVGMRVGLGSPVGQGYHTVPGGWYASFAYGGDLEGVRPVFEADLYRWLAVRDIMPNPEGPGMVSILERSSGYRRPSSILVPILVPGKP